MIVSARALLALVLVATSYAGAARLVQRALRGDSPGQRVLATLAVAPLGWLALGTLLGAVGLFRYPAIVASAIISSATMWRLGATVPWANARARLLAWADASRARWLLPVPLVAYAVLLARAVTRPPLAWDALAQHLTLPAQWIRAGGFVPFALPNEFHFFTYYPRGSEVLTGLSMALLGGELGAGLAGFFVAVLAAAALYKVARALGAHEAPALGAAALLAMTPAFARYVPTAYVEPALDAFLLVALAFALGHKRGWLVGAALGGAAAVKVVALPIGAAVFVAFVAVRWKQCGARSAAKGALVAAAVALAVGGYWYAWDWLVMGNPFFPVRVGPFAGYSWGADLTGGSTTLSLLREKPGAVLDAWMGAPRPWERELGLGPQLVWAVPLAAFALVRPRRRFEALAVLGVAAAALAAYLLLGRAQAWPFSFVRFAVPAFALLLALAASALPATDGVAAWALAACALDATFLWWPVPSSARLTLGLAGAFAIIVRYALRARPASGPVLAALGVVAVAVALAAGDASMRAARAAPDAWAESDLHQTDAPLYAPAWRWLDANAVPGAIVAVAADQDALYFPLFGHLLERGVVYLPTGRAASVDPTRWRDAPPSEDADADAWLARLRAAGAGYLVVQSGKPLEERRFADARPDVFEPVVREKAVTVYRLR